MDKNTQQTNETVKLDEQNPSNDNHTSEENSSNITKNIIEQKSANPTKATEHKIAEQKDTPKQDPKKTQEERELNAEKELKNLMSELNNLNSNPMTSQAQLKRLMSTNFVNPYEILMILPDATEEEIRKQYKTLSLLVHPDKCGHDPRASDAFHVLETGYKTLLDPEKRKVYQRIMREARERVEYERNKENKRREKKGLPILPNDTLDSEVKEMVKRIMDEIDEKKKFLEKQNLTQEKREREEVEYKKMQDDYEKQYNKEWESSRDKRVKNWRKFTEKITNGKKKGKFETRPPHLKMEERPEIYGNSRNFDGNKLGSGEEFRRPWNS